MEMICCFYPIAYYIYVFGQSFVGFGCIAAVRPFKKLKSFRELIWNCNAVESCLELRSLCVSLKIIHTFESSSANQIQAFNGLVV